MLALAGMLALLVGAAGSAETDPAVKWTAQHTATHSRLRGLSAFDQRTAWASGSDNTVLHSDDGGEHWHASHLPPAMLASPLDFRDIDAVSRDTAYLLSIGPGEASRIYKTVDAGANWIMQYQNSDPQGFLDAMTFWDAQSGLVIGDAIDGHLQILITEDGGTSWHKISDEVLPRALPNEGAFSASGSNIAVAGTHDAWIATGAVIKSRVLHTSDRGHSWTVVDTPIATSESAGIFSIAFRDAVHGVVVGGDYKQETLAHDNVAITQDGGKTWQLVREHGLSGYRSSVKYLPGRPGTLIAVGPSGADLSTDDGKSWQPLAMSEQSPGFDALTVSSDGNVWASGDQGRLSAVQLPRR